MVIFCVNHTTEKSELVHRSYLKRKSIRTTKVSVTLFCITSNQSAANDKKKNANVLPKLGRCFLHMDKKIAGYSTTYLGIYSSGCVTWSADMSWLSATWVTRFFSKYGMYDRFGYFLEGQFSSPVCFHPYIWKDIIFVSIYYLLTNGWSALQ